MRLQSIKNIPRIGDITRILVRHGLHQLVHQLGLPLVDKFRGLLQRAPEPWEDVSKSLPVRLRRVLQDLGPTYVKLGQILSTRHDLLNDEFIDELSKLQDSVPPMPMTVVREVVSGELGAPIEDLFEHFEETALAAASIGQVHRAVTMTGREVVVKVQRQGIVETIGSDIDILFFIARLMKENEILDETYDPVEIVEEFSHSIRRELDYGREARNIRTFRKNFEGNEHIHIPEVFPELSCERVLCMEYIKGVKASSVTADTHDCKAIARHGVDAVLQQVFVDGCFHADPHPGNILIMGRAKVCFVDFGMIGRLSLKMRDNLSNLLIALSGRDWDLLAREIVQVSGPRGEVDLEAFSSALLETMDPYYGLTLRDINVGKLIRECLDVVARYKIRFPASYSLMLKSLITVESLGHQLDEDFDMMAAVQPFVEQLVYRRFGPDRLKRDIVLAAKDLTDIVRRAPFRVEGILSRVQRGDLSVQFVHKGLDPLVRNLDEGSNRVAFSLVISGLIVGSSIIMTKPQPTLIGGWNVGIAMFWIAGLLGLGLAISIAKSGRF